jgi:hypothetical protein
MRCYITMRTHAKVNSGGPPPSPVNQTGFMPAGVLSLFLFAYSPPSATDPALSVRNRDSSNLHAPASGLYKCWPGLGWSGQQQRLPPAGIVAERLDTVAAEFLPALPITRGKRSRSSATALLFHDLVSNIFSQSHCRPWEEALSPLNCLQCLIFCS